MVFAYVYFTRIIVYLVRATMPCKYGCVSVDVKITRCKHKLDMSRKYGRLLYMCILRSKSCFNRACVYVHLEYLYLETHKF